MSPAPTPTPIPPATNLFVNSWRSKPIEKRSFNAYVAEASVSNSLNWLAVRGGKNSTMDVEDAKQELLMSCFRSYKSYDPNKGKFNTYSINLMNHRAKTLIDSNQSRYRLFNSEEAENLPDDRIYESVVEREIEARKKIDMIENVLNHRKGKSVPDQRVYDTFLSLRCGE